MEPVNTLSTTIEPLTYGRDFQLNHPLLKCSEIFLTISHIFKRNHQIDSSWQLCQSLGIESVSVVCGDHCFTSDSVGSLVSFRCYFVPLYQEKCCMGFSYLGYVLRGRTKIIVQVGKFIFPKQYDQKRCNLRKSVILSQTKTIEKVMSYDQAFEKPGGTFCMLHR